MPKSNGPWPVWRVSLTLWLGLVLPVAADWNRATEPREFFFPTDHFSHPDFKTEWWYVTGNLESPGKRRFGFQFTLFRQGIRAPGERPEVESRWIVDHLHFGHFAITDPQTGRFLFSQKFERGNFGEAGTGTDPEEPLAWIGDWKIEFTDPGFRIAARIPQEDAGLELMLRPQLGPVLNGDHGLSRKAGGEGNASYYYAFPRLKASGRITLDGKPIPVTGLAWLDREWSTSVLGENQVGWDWFALQLDDGSTLMLYQLRQESGEPDPHSSGTHVAADGTVTPLKAGDFSLQAKRIWKNPEGVRYPVVWTARVPQLDLAVEVSAVLDAQELRLKPVAYWEGAVDVKGSHTGRGYLEMTGYNGQVRGLSSDKP